MSEVMKLDWRMTNNTNHDSYGKFECVENVRGYCYFWR